MCGPSQAETGLQGQETGFMNTYAQNYQQQFAGQSAVINNLNNIFGSTVAKGPSQTGMSAGQLAGENTMAIDATGAANKNSQIALGNQVAGQGNSTVQSGVQQALKAGLNSQSAGQLAGQQLGITQQNYAMGNQQYNQALAGEGEVANLLNPAGSGSLTQGAEGASFGQANTINQQNQQAAGEIAGGITALGGMAMGGIGNLDSTGSSSGGEQAGNFLQGMFS